ncbi:hypothetical protein B0H14DRAFT_2582846 [Mycena olivaceomarginata]|nr:hypothetical protein B0H14DRAFT_2582846 [Mycena olivaceomarginata]
MAVRVYKQSLRLPERPWSIFLTGTDRTGKHDCIRPSSRYSKGKPENCVFRPLRMVDVEVAYGFASNLFNLGHHGTDRWGKQPLAVYTSPLYPMDVRRPRNLYAFGAEIVDGFEKWSVRKEPELWQDSIDESGKDGPGGWGTVLRRALRRALTDGGANLT